MRRRYLVTYDISDDKRRNGVFKTLMSNGNHVQFSVFLCELNRKELAGLKGRLGQMINHREDQVLLLDMGTTDHDLAATLRCIGKKYRPPARVRVV